MCLDEKSRQYDKISVPSQSNFLIHRLHLHHCPAFGDRLLVTIVICHHIQFLEESKNKRAHLMQCRIMQIIQHD